VSPWTIERAPAELLAIIPPRVARLDDATSGPNASPCAAAAAFRRSRTTPGPTRATRRSGSIAIASRAEQSTTSPRPTAWPARLVPPARTVRGTPWAPQAAIAASRSSSTTARRVAAGSRR